MYPFEKQNLVPYRSLALGGLALFVCAVGFGILFRRPTGLWLASTVAVASISVVMAFFAWHHEPTAKRQFATLFLALVVYGIVGAVSVDVLLAKYHAIRGECPDWMFVSGRCG